MKLRAKRTMRYAGQRLAAGDEFETRGETDAKILIAVNHAEAVAPKPKGKPGRKARSEDATPIAIADDDLTVSNAREYHRRDMEAERE